MEQVEMKPFLVASADGTRFVIMGTLTGTSLTAFWGFGMLDRKFYTIYPDEVTFVSFDVEPI